VSEIVLNINLNFCNKTINPACKNLSDPDTFKDFQKAYNDIQMI